MPIEKAVQRKWYHMEAENAPEPEDFFGFHLIRTNIIHPVQDEAAYPPPRHESHE